MDDDFDAHYGLLTSPQTVVVRPYSDDSDDQVLQEIKPRFIVMYEPNLEFIRRIEARLSHLSTRLSLTLVNRFTETRTLVSASACTL